MTQVLDALYRLKVGVVGAGGTRHERPHKPVLLLAVLDAMEAGTATPERVEWGRGLRERFAQYFEIVRSRDDDCTPENPFYYLGSDGFWQPFKLDGSGERELEAPPRAADADTGRVYARFVPDWRPFLADPVSRAAMRRAIVARFFPDARASLDELSGDAAADLGQDQKVIGRSAAFRRQVLEIYDYQCCACGLRILIPDREITFVDAAHVIPFAETGNDHPSNGIALCKNHHWAMDQALIAPDPERVWRVSREIDARRSKGEEELGKIGGQRMLLTEEPAYGPDPRGLVWRFSRLRTG